MSKDVLCMCVYVSYWDCIYHEHGLSISVAWSCFILSSTLALYSKIPFWCFKAPERNQEDQGRKTSEEGQEREKEREEREEEGEERREKENQAYSQ